MFRLHTSQLIQKLRGGAWALGGFKTLQVMFIHSRLESCLPTRQLLRGNMILSFNIPQMLVDFLVNLKGLREKMKRETVLPWETTEWCLQDQPILVPVLLTLIPSWVFLPPHAVPSIQFTSAASIVSIQEAIGFPIVKEITSGTSPWGSGVHRCGPHLTLQPVLPQSPWVSPVHQSCQARRNPLGILLRCRQCHHRQAMPWPQLL